MQKLGILLMVLGAAGMDSPNLIVPSIMVLVGLAIIKITTLKENSFAPNRPK